MHKFGISQVSLKDSLLIGGIQIFALIPGSSRSAVTMLAALALGFTKSDAARFSFLLAVPTLSIVFFGELVDLSHATYEVNYIELGYVATLSFFSAISCIHFFLKFI